jgi:formate-dependent phosphoribosylglycinamide formyltransferase (GAR transformylase)
MNKMAVPAFRQVSDMRKPQEIKAIVEENKPVFVLKNSEVCFVAISQSQYEEFENLKGRRVLYAQLAVAEAEHKAGAPCLTHEEVFKNLRAKVNGL